MRIPLLFFLLCLAGTSTVAWSQDGGSHSASTDLRAAAVKVDITPPIGTPLAGYGDRGGASTAVKDPLRAGVIVFAHGDARAAIVTLDLISIGEAETRRIRELIAERTGFSMDHVLVNASHTHGAPRPDLDTVYGRTVVADVAGAVEAATARLQPASLGYAEDEIGACVNRRLLNNSGVAEMKPNPSGDFDPRVRVVRVDGAGGNPLAVLFHVACHANVFRNENTEVTADYPGYAQHFVEDVFRGAPAMYLSGAGGDIRPNLPSEDGFRNGDDADLAWVGLDVGAAVVQAAALAGSRESVARRDTSYPISALTRRIDLPAKDGGSLSVEIQAVRVGRFLFLTIPGEPFIAYNRQVEGALARDGHKVMVVGYANGSHGYFCTAESYEHGGYEPGVSKLAPDAEPLLVAALVELGREVL